MSMDREEIGEFAKILVQSLDPIEVSSFYRTYHEITEFSLAPAIESMNWRA